MAHIDNIIHAHLVGQTEETDTISSVLVLTDPEVFAL